LLFSCSALLFDLDGVLVDSTPAVARTWRAWAIEHHLSPEVAINKAHGRRSIETIRELAPHLDAEEENRRVERMEIEDREGVLALPGAARLLRVLPPERYAIVTSATRELAVARLGYAGLPAPANLVSADDVRDGKPSPEPYLAGAKLLGMNARDCLVFEDAPAGITSARAAEMRVIALETTYSARELEGADAVVKSLDEVEVTVQANKIEVQVSFPVNHA
jgi:sugar-phosphatase